MGVNSVSDKLVGIVLSGLFQDKLETLLVPVTKEEKMRWNATKNVEGQLEVTVGELLCRTCGNDGGLKVWTPFALQNLWG